MKTDKKFGTSDTVSIYLQILSDKVYTQELKNRKNLIEKAFAEDENYPAADLEVFIC